MSGWQILIWGAATAAGTLLFLKLVANEIERSMTKLHRMEDRANKELRKLRAMGGQAVEVALEGGAGP